MATTDLKRVVATVIRAAQSGGDEAAQRVIDSLAVTDSERANVADSARQQRAIDQPSRAKYIRTY